jgi:hypothetical protein
MELTSINNVLVKQSQSDSNEGFMELLLATESAILNFKRQHPMIKNAYWYFAEQLGYKSKNYLYEIFEQRLHYKLSVQDVKKIYELTNDEALKHSWQQYL